MTPLGHISASIVTGHSFKKLCMPALIVGGVLPDIDFIFILAGFFNQVHRVITHNLTFIFLASLIAMFIVGKEKSATVGMSMVISGALHLFIDSVMDNNPSNGIGVSLFWPFSDVFFSPFNILTPATNPYGWNDPLQMLKSILPNLLYEIPFYLYATFCILRQRACRQAE